MAKDLINATLLKLYDDNLKEVAGLLQRNKLYNIDDTVKYYGKFIKCTVGGTTDTATLTALKTANIGDTLSDGNVTWEVIADNGSSASSTISDWRQSYKYTANDLVYYNDIIYKANKTHTSSTDFTVDVNNWDVFCASLPVWNAGNFYKSGCIVEYSNKIYKCKLNNSDTVFTEANWDVIGGESSVDTWKPNTAYKVNDLVIYNDKLYICITQHNSTADFNNDASFWLLLSPNEQNIYKQINKLNVTANTSFDVDIQRTDAFVFPPIEVLKIIAGGTNITQNSFTFSTGDGAKFIVDNVDADKSKFVIFDGMIYPNHKYIYDLDDYTKMVDNYYRVTDEIDSTKFKTIEDVNLIE